jgi:hypothetical protein
VTVTARSCVFRPLRLRHPRAVPRAGQRSAPATAGLQPRQRRALPSARLPPARWWPTRPRAQACRRVAEVSTVDLDDGAGLGERRATHPDRLRDLNHASTALERPHTSRNRPRSQRQGPRTGWQTVAVTAGAASRTTARRSPAQTSGGRLPAPGRPSPPIGLDPSDRVGGPRPPTSGTPCSHDLVTRPRSPGQASSFPRKWPPTSVTCPKSCRGDVPRTGDSARPAPRLPFATGGRSSTSERYPPSCYARRGPPLAPLRTPGAASKAARSTRRTADGAAVRRSLPRVARVVDRASGQECGWGRTNLVARSLTPGSVVPSWAPRCQPGRVRPRHARRPGRSVTAVVAPERRAIGANLIGGPC